MSVENLVILHENVVCVVVQEDAVAAVHHDFAGARVMGEGVISAYIFFILFCVHLGGLVPSFYHDV